MTYLDLTRPDLFQTEHFESYFAQLRRERPVSRDDHVQLWMITGYDEVAQAYTDDALSSAKGTIIGGSLNSNIDSASNKMLICSDDPHHKRLRALCAPAFLRNAITEAMHITSEYLTIALDTVPRNQPVDYLNAVLRVIPVAFLQACFPMSFEDARQIIELTQNLIGHADNPAAHNRGGTVDGRALAHLRLLLAVRNHYRRVVQSNQSTLIENSTKALHELSEEEIIYNLLNIAVGGNETTPFTAAAITYHMLCGDTDRYIADYMADPTGFVNEALRWTTTNAYVQRYVSRDTVIADQLLQQGDYALLWNYSANRDEKYYTSEFTPSRPHPVSHLSFGRGRHRCIGANVAVAELSTYLEFVVPHIHRIKPVHAPTVLCSNFMRGFTSMPVKIA